MSGGSPAAGVPFVLVVTPDLQQRLERAVGLARAAAYQGRHPQVLEDVNVILARLADGSENGTTFPDPRKLDAMGRMVTVQTAADRVGCGDRAIRKAIEAGRLPAEKVGHAWLIGERDLDHYRLGGRFPRQQPPDQKETP